MKTEYVVSNNNMCHNDNWALLHKYERVCIPIALNFLSYFSLTYGSVSESDAFSPIFLMMWIAKVLVFKLCINFCGARNMFEMILLELMVWCHPAPSLGGGHSYFIH